MAAHSSTTAAVALPVPADQPPTGWASWLRQIAGVLNLLGAKATEIDADMAAEEAARIAADNSEASARAAADAALAPLANPRFTGSVGINASSPRTALDTGLGPMSGAAEDYRQAQTTMSGGGTITWAGPGGKLKWTARFLCIPGAYPTLATGFIAIDQPLANIPAGQVYNGVARTADAAGVVLNAFEALYAAHTPGGAYTAVTFYIVKYDTPFFAPSNWILVAAINGDDGKVKLGTGQIL